MKLLMYDVKIEKKKAATMVLAAMACVATALFVIAYIYIAHDGIVEHRKSDINRARQYHEITLIYAETVPVKTGLQAKTILFFSFMLSFLCIWKASHNLIIKRIAKDDRNTH